ncbi:unnamed protein product [Mytilus coruscus]|uniref:Uncharacterized protein n=1 Tax=Mytilus coruscus TaxID=42192 RepID=A0A6J8AE12_MYTCO|nr:unnamed protein product [Mytilus coruscus]
MLMPCKLTLFCLPIGRKYRAVCLNCRLRVCKISQETCTDVSSSVQTFTANQSKTVAMEYSEDVVGIDLTETVDHSRAKRKQDDAYSHQEISENEFYFSAFSQETQMSCQNNSQSSQRTIHQIESLEKLNSFLLCEGLDTISMPTSLWASYSRKTQLSYMKKISACIRAIVMTIFEEDVDIILQQLASYDSGNYESSSTNTNETDTELLKSLADSYSKAESWQYRDSTMFKILSECTATMRKSLEHVKGLDYYLAEGVRAFRELEDVLAELHKMGSISLSDNTFKQQRFIARMKYALSSQDQDHFQSCCDHDHDHVCEHCEQISELLHAISKLVNECQVSDKDIYLYTFSQAKEKILNWKCHIIRSRNQGVAKSDLLDSLEESEVVIVLDWAMKYLPRRYREDQSNWYAKRGISWHIGVAFRRTEGNLQSLTFVHIFHSQISQDSVTTSVILDIVEDLNTKYEDISKCTCGLIMQAVTNVQILLMQ